MEFLIGRSLVNNLVNLGLLEPARAVLADLGVSLADLEETEPDAALGNGGLGRLAACFLDSLATLGLPGFGYGINYEYGLFQQEIRNGEQVEKADNWRTYDTPWEIERPQDAVLVPLYGRIEHAADRAGGYNPMWLDWKVVVGVPHDMLDPRLRRPHRQLPAPVLRAGVAGRGHDRLQRGRLLPRCPAESADGNDLQSALSAREFAAGRELRLVQEYFLAACAVRDIVRRYQRDHDDLRPVRRQGRRPAQRHPPDAGHRWS